MMSKKQFIYRITAIAATIVFMISIGIMSGFYQIMFHTVGIIASCLLVTSIIIKNQAISSFTLATLVFISGGGFFAAWFMSNNFDEWTMTMLISLILYVVLLLLDLYNLPKTK